MAKFVHILLELTYDLSNAYKDYILVSSSKDYTYKFLTEKDTEYVVKFSRDSKDPGQYERVYFPTNILKTKGSEKRLLTGEGDALRINATVMMITLDFLDKIGEKLRVLLIRPISSSRMAIVKKLIDNNLPSKFSWEEVNDDILIYPNTIMEYIDPEEADTDEKSIQTIIDKKRDVAAIGGKISLLLGKKIQDAKLGIIRVNNDTGGLYVIYKPGSESKANELATIAKKYGGLLSYKATPEDSERIGQLLSYNPEKIKQYVQKTTTK